MISATALTEFKQIWFEEFGNEISDDQAIHEAVNLLTLFDAIYHPLKESWVSDAEIDDH